MQITSILAIYFLFWVFTAFLMLPFGVRTAEEAGEPLVPGQAESAPVNFNPRRVAGRASVVAAVLTALFVVNYQMGWVTMADLDFLPKPPPSIAR
jgi:predicted secreted protein